MVSTAILAILDNKMLEIHMTHYTLHFMETHESQCSQNDVNLTTLLVTHVQPTAYV